MSQRYFELLDHVGVDADGQPEPIQEIGLAIARPTMLDGRVAAVANREVLKPIAGHDRIVTTDDPAVADGIVGSGLFCEIDPPKSERGRDDARPTRSQLNARAASLGVPGPEALPNRQAVEDAIAAAEQAQTLNANDAPAGDKE